MAGRLSIIVALIALVGSILSATLPALLDHFLPPQNPQDRPAQPDAPREMKADNQPGYTYNQCRDSEDKSLRTCWGTIDLKDTGTAIRTFSLKFASAFAVPPVVTASVTANGTGYAFGIYNFKLTETNYWGHAIETQDRATHAPVSLSFIAIGPPAPK